MEDMENRRQHPEIHFFQVTLAWPTSHHSNPQASIPQRPRNSLCSTTSPQPHSRECRSPNRETVDLRSQTTTIQSLQCFVALIRQHYHWREIRVDLVVDAAGRHVGAGAAVDEGVRFAKQELCRVLEAITEVLDD